MDLYPDIAVELGEIERDSGIHRVTNHLMQRAYQSCDLIIALDEDMAERIGAKDVPKAVVPPWPPEIHGSSDSVDTGTSPPSVEDLGNRNSPRPFVWLYSGNLGRAHEWQTLLDAQRIIENRGLEVSLTFQGGGAEIPNAKIYADKLGIERCTWTTYAEEDQLLATLLAANCLIATQRPETIGCLWPSKLALAVCLDRNIIWVGPKSSCVSNWLEKDGHSTFQAGDAEPLASHVEALMRLSERDPISQETIRDRVGNSRRDGIGSVASLIQGY